MIAGSARGRALRPPAGNRVRPTADRVKEAIFSSLTSRFGSLEGLRILDLFSGSGSLGIEALSRGADSAVFVDSHRESIALARTNLQLTGFDKAATLILLDAPKALQQLSGNGKTFDIVLADPPYAGQELTEKVLSLLAALELTTPEGVVILETAARCELTIPADLSLAGRKVYGDTAVWLFERTD